MNSRKIYPSANCKITRKVFKTRKTDARLTNRMLLKTTTEIQLRKLA